MKLPERQSSDDGLDISPLIDMVFILLIFFMVSTTFVKDQNIGIERPSAASATRASSKAIRVQIEQTGQVHLNGVPTRTWMLQSRLGDLFALSTDRSVLVITDRRVPAELLVEVVDQCRLAGAADVGVATDLEAG